MIEWMKIHSFFLQKRSIIDTSKGQLTYLAKLAFITCGK